MTPRQRHIQTLTFGQPDRIEPVVQDGGFIPGCDHGVPSDVSWPNFIDYGRRLARMTGWL